MPPIDRKLYRSVFPTGLFLSAKGWFWGTPMFMICEIEPSSPRTCVERVRTLWFGLLKGTAFYFCSSVACLPPLTMCALGIAPQEAKRIGTPVRLCSEDQCARGLSSPFLGFFLTKLDVSTYSILALRLRYELGTDLSAVDYSVVLCCEFQVLPIQFILFYGSNTILLYASSRLYAVILVLKAQPYELMLGPPMLANGLKFWRLGGPSEFY